jgi:hypothetical protein
MTGKDVIKYIRAQRIQWWKHLNKKGKTETVKKIMEWNAIGTRYKKRQKIDGETVC